MNNAREYIGKPEVYEDMRMTAFSMAIPSAEDLVQDACERMLNNNSEYEGEEHFRSHIRFILAEQRRRRWQHDSRAKRTPETDCLFDPPVVEPVVDETFRLASWADDPTLKLALRREQGYTLTEMAEEEGVTRQAIEERIRRKIASLSRSFSMRHSTEESA